MIDERRLARMRWRCRRGMLENDLILSALLDSRGAAIDEDEIAMLDRLLDLPDNELWDLIAGRAEPGDPSVRPLVDVVAQDLTLTVEAMGERRRMTFRSVFR